MGLYEIMFIIRPDLEDEEHEEIINELTRSINTNDGQVDRVADWRKRRLAYEIDKHVEGHYYLLYFKGSGDIIPEIEHFFRVNDGILRYLIMRIEEDIYEAAIAEEADQSEQPVESETLVDEGESEAAEQATSAPTAPEGEPAADSETDVTADTTQEEPERE